MQKLVKLLNIEFPSMAIREHENNHSKEVSALFNKTKPIEKSKEKEKKVFHMIFLDLSTKYMNLGQGRYHAHKSTVGKENYQHFHQAY